MTPPVVSGNPWTGTILREFGGPNEAYPNASSPAFDSSGNLWVTTTNGGVYNRGTLTALATPTGTGQPWTTKSFFSFPGGSQGGLPDEGVVVGPDGTVYGTLSSAGENNRGTIYQYVP